MTDYFDIAEAGGLCECGVSLDRHGPLPKPRPIQSWHSQRALRVSFGTVMTLTPGELAQRQAAARGRAQQARHVRQRAMRVMP